MDAWTGGSAMKTRVLLRLALAMTLALVGTIPLIANPSKVSADGCYTWGRTLRNGMSGSDVRQLQIRVGGWPGYHNFVNIDGQFGDETEAAVKRFQSAYGLTADGIAGPQTFNKIYALQDADCTPIHFAYSEFASCQGGFSGGAVSADKVKSNLLRVMWRLEGLRKKLANGALYVASGFRSYACNTGVSNSQHLYGTAADLTQGTSRAALCAIALKARYSGFSGIIAPGSSDGDHEDHVHVDIRAENNDDGITNGFFWDTTCF
jgi:zinc D-Ala-D-Ala carboxypeptidase